MRRSRRRFWKSGDDKDKSDAYKTLHYVLVRLMYVMAPFTPFLAEEYYQKLTGNESIHLEDWLPGGHTDELALQTMEFVKQAVNEGLSLRAKNQLKVRQPLASVKVSGAPSGIENLQEYSQMIVDELNVKKVDCQAGGEFVVELDTTLTLELKREGLMREVIRHIQSTRKNAGLNVDNRIHLKLETNDSQLKKAIDEHLGTIKTETLTTSMHSIEDGFSQEVKIENSALKITLKKS